MNQNSIHIERLLLLEAPRRYRKMWHRPIQADLTERDLDILAESTNGGQNITARSVGGLAGRVLRPISHVESEVHIPNGMDENRFLFMMEVSVSSMGTVTTHTIQGYTDYLGVSRLSGRKTLDPDMVFTVNGSMALRRVDSRTGFGGLILPTVTESLHILRPDVSAGRNVIRGGRMTGSISIRPEDIINRVEQKEISDAFDGMPVRCASNTFNNGLKRSRRSNGCATDYLLRTLTAARDAVGEVSRMRGTNDQMYEQIRSQLAEPGIASHDFYYALGKHTDFNRTASFTFADIEDMQPDLEIEVVMSGEVSRVHGVGIGLSGSRQDDSENWDGSNNTAIAASIMASSLPAIMTQLFVTRVHFSVTNMTEDNEPCFVLYTAESFSANVDERFIRDFEISFRNKLIDEILNAISYNGQMAYDIDVDLDILTEGCYEISLDGDSMTRFVAPAFCDSLYSPVVTTNQIIYDNLADDIEKMIKATAYGRVNNDRDTTLSSGTGSNARRRLI